MVFGHNRLQIEFFFENYFIFYLFTWLDKIQRNHIKIRNIIFKKTPYLVTEQTMIENPMANGESRRFFFIQSSDKDSQNKD